MNHGVNLIIYPVNDMGQAKGKFSKRLGLEPYFHQPDDAGFKVGEQEIGLDPNGHQQGMTGPLGYFQVEDIRVSPKILLEAGAQLH